MSTLRIDQIASGIFNRAAIVVGTHDAELAFQVCAELAEIEPHYRLALRTGDDATRGQPPASRTPSSSGSGRSFQAKYAGQCARCGKSFPVGAPIVFNDARKTVHAGCA